MDTQSTPTNGRGTAAIPPAHPDDIVSRMPGHGARHLVTTIEQMIRDGALIPGQRLPSIRAIAIAGGMSPTTVSESWRILHAGGLLHTEGRRGTHVSFLAQRTPTGRWRLTGGKRVGLDLSSGSPDPELLPPVLLNPEELAGLFRRSTYYGTVVEPELERAIRDEWGDSFDPERVTVVDGSLDAVDRLTTLLLAPGDVVVMEEPSYPPLWQLMHANRCVVRAIEVDAEGPRPSRLHLAAAAHPRLFIFQPRAQNPTGAAVTPERLAALAAELAPLKDMLILELDSAGSMSGAPLLSLATYFPDRVIRVQGFSKSHSPDLRLAAVGGPAALIDRLEERRLLGPGWSSRALQHVLAHLLDSSEARAHVEGARAVYAGRVAAFVEALGDHGVAVDGVDGFNVWLPVPDAEVASSELAGQGVAVAVGRPFLVNPTARDHIRVTVATLRELDAPWVAALIAEVMRTPVARRILR